MKIDWKLFFLSVVILTSSIVTGCLFFYSLVFLAKTAGFGWVIGVIVLLSILALSFILSYEVKE